MIKFFSLLERSMVRSCDANVWVPRKQLRMRLLRGASPPGKLSIARKFANGTDTYDSVGGSLLVVQKFYSHALVVTRARKALCMVMVANAAVWIARVLFLASSPTQSYILCAQKGYTRTSTATSNIDNNANAKSHCLVHEPWHAPLVYKSGK